MSVIYRAYIIKDDLGFKDLFSGKSLTIYNGVVNLWHYN